MLLMREPLVLVKQLLRYQVACPSCLLFVAQPTAALMTRRAQPACKLALQFLCAQPSLS